MRHLAAIVLLLSFGCADGKSPVEPTPSPPVPAQFTFTLQGDVRDTASRPLTGVFGTRSPDRPNPIGLHRVTIREVDGSRIRVGPLEAIDGTPVIDIKPVLDSSDDA